MKNRSPRGDGARRKHVTYANVASTLALVLAIGGGTAWAAHHYIITKASQIKPSVVTALRGNVGPAGATGATGVTGAAGAVGPATGAAGGALAGNYPNPTLAPIPAFTAISVFEDGWQALGGANLPPSYTKTSEGVVYLQGVITCTNTSECTNSGYSQPAFTLPVGYRVDGSFAASASTSNVATANDQLSCGVHIFASSGAVLPMLSCPEGTGTSVSLAGISFVPTG